MSSPSKTPQSDRHHGGPGSSHQGPDRPDPAAGRKPVPGQPTNPGKSKVSGGGGERDTHHTHDPRGKAGAR